MVLMITQQVLEELRRIVGPAYVRTDADTIRENSTDATKFFHPADVILFPENAGHVSHWGSSRQTGSARR